MSNRISPEHMAEIKAMTRGVLPSQLLGHIAVLEAENHELVQDIDDLLANISSLEASLETEAERLRAVADAVRARVTPCDPDCKGRQSCPDRMSDVCVALAALEEEVGE